MVDEHARLTHNHKKGADGVVCIPHDPNFMKTIIYIGDQEKEGNT